MQRSIRLGSPCSHVALALLSLTLSVVGCQGLVRNGGAALEDSQGPTRPLRPADRIEPTMALRIRELPASEAYPVRPVGAVALPDGSQMDYIENEIIVHAPDPTILERFERDYGAQIIHGGELPLPPDADPSDISAELRNFDFYLLRVDPSRADTGRFEERMNRVGSGEEVRFSSMNALGLLAIVLEEQLDHDLNVQPNLLTNLSFDCDVLTSTEEEPVAGVGFSDGFELAWTKDTVWGVSRAWQYFRLLPNTRSPRIAIVDVGFQVNEDFPPANQIVQFDSGFWRFGVDVLADVNGSSAWHGMRVASVAAARLGNRYGAVGVAGTDASRGEVDVNLIFCLPLSGSLIPRPIYELSVCVQVAALAKADVINMSTSVECGKTCRAFGFFTGYTSLKDSIKKATNSGSIVIVAAGNNGAGNRAEGQDIGPGGTALVPARMANVLTVGAAELKSRRAATFSNYGDPVDIWAPGDGIPVSPIPPMFDKTTRFSGTSAATPFVSGVVAMMKSIDPSLHLMDVRDILQSTAGFSPDPKMTAGFIRCLAALQETARRAGLVPRVDPFEPNETRFSATSILPATAPATFEGTILPGDDDYFAFDFDDYQEGVQIGFRQEGAGGINPLKMSVTGKFGDPLAGALVATSPIDVQFQSGILSPATEYVIHVSGEFGSEINCYELTYSGTQSASLPPDVFDDEFFDNGAPGEARNDTWQDAAVITLQPKAFHLTVGPFTQQTGHRGANVVIPALNFHEVTDLDYFLLQVDASYQHSPEIGVDCLSASPVPLPPGFSTVLSRPKGSLNVRKFQSSGLVGGTKVWPRGVPIAWDLRDENGVDISGEPYVTIDPILGVTIECPFDNLPGGRLIVGLDPGSKRDYYGLDVWYKEPHFIIRDQAGIAHLLEQTLKVLDIGLDEIQILSPPNPGPKHLVQSRRPPAEDQQVSKLAILDWPERQTLRLGIETSHDGPEGFDVSLMDAEGNELASDLLGVTSPGREGFPFTVRALRPGAYLLRIMGANAQAEYTVRLRTNDVPGER